MKIGNQSFELIYPITKEGFIQEAKLIEVAARNCYKSEDKITDDSWKKFLTTLKDRNHGAMLEFGRIMAKFITDRGVSHELVRHRLCNFAQESTRYCSYNKDKFDNQITVISPFVEQGDDKTYKIWHDSCKEAEKAYFGMLEQKYTPQDARSVLPNSLKTEIVVSTNFREWQHIFKLRAISKAAHPMIRKLLIPMYVQVIEYLPEVFDLGPCE